MNAGLGGNPSAGVVLGGLDYGLGGIGVSPAGAGAPFGGYGGYGAPQPGFGGAPHAGGYGAPQAPAGYGAPQAPAHGGFGSDPFGAAPAPKPAAGVAFNPFDM